MKGLVSQCFARWVWMEDMAVGISVLRVLSFNYIRSRLLNNPSPPDLADLARSFEGISFLLWTILLCKLALQLVNFWILRHQASGVKSGSRYP